jgi:hypothetical protein
MTRLRQKPPYAVQNIVPQAILEIKKFEHQLHNPYQTFRNQYEMPATFVMATCYFRAIIRIYSIPLYQEQYLVKIGKQLILCVLLNTDSI